MNDKAVVDTSVVVDAIIEEAQKHLRAREQLAKLNKITIPSVVLYELIWVLNRLGVRPDAVFGAVDTLVRNPKVSVATDEGELSLKALQRVVGEKTALSNFNDKVVLETSLRLGLPLVTYDKELEKEWKRAAEARRQV